ncbi:hypothetical protein F0L17_14980 [Streptomyces sp. TRM43335]|uniref:Uncharacterized protein n=1 Tax=Streptomyces taklimakanensis TaxID=2569853 RepID=A0A6G2BDQ8_9ACTN|nr:hypothetical protein [Streptomyces taklimakanensis]MTE20388.1 hypothetical protein [Streptomyces taklimakanensis]
MPTPHGSRGALVFSAAELRVLRSALALVLHSERAPFPRAGERAPTRAEVLRECLELAEAVDEASREADRLRDFLQADLGRYRAALPGSGTGYLARLEEALAAGCPPCPADVTALRGLCAEPVGDRERRRRDGLLRLCEDLCGASRRAPASSGDSEPPRTREAAPGPEGSCEGRRDGTGRGTPEVERSRSEPVPPVPPVSPHPAGRGRLSALPHPVPTPAEVFPVGRRASSGPRRQALPA